MKEAPKVYGTVTVGQRGQVVIPMKARRALKIKKGDQMIVLSGPPGKKELISLIPLEKISGFLRSFEDHIESLKKELAKEVRG